MFNQEQLAAIAAAMSVLQQSLRSNSPAATTNAANIDPVADTNSINHLHLHHNNNHHHQSTSPNCNTNGSNNSISASHHQHAEQQANLANELQSVAGLRALAQLEWQQQQHHLNLREDQHHLQQQQQQQQQQQHHNHLQQQQQALINHYQSQLHQSNLHLAPSPTKQQQQHHLQQQDLVNHYQSQLHPQQSAELQRLTTTSPPRQRPVQLQPQLQQQQQQQQALINHYQSQLQQQQPELQHIALKAQKPQQQQPQPQQQQVLSKPNRPVSYSAIVAKSAGLTNNNIVGNTNTTTTNNGVINNISGTNGNNINTATCNYAFSGPNNNSTFNAATNNSSTNSDTTTSSTTLNTITSTKLQNNINTNNNQTFRGVSATNGIARNSLTNHSSINTNNIFNANNLTGNTNGLGHSNGSLLNPHHHSNLLALEPTINYTTEHSISPAQQLFQQTENLNQLPIQHQQTQQHQLHNHNQINTSLSNNTPSPGSATNLLGFMGLYVGNLSPDLTKEQLEKIFSKYGEPVKAHRLIRSPVAFIKYENIESPRAAIDDLYGLLLPELTLNQDQPLKLHFDRNDAQLKANYRPTELPPKMDNGECYGWRTTVCRRGKNCPKKHIPINRGIDFQMWMIKSTPSATS